jgi:hypothetical protein
MWLFIYLFIYFRTKIIFSPSLFYASEVKHGLRERMIKEQAAQVKVKAFPLHAVQAQSGARWRWVVKAKRMRI